MGKEIKKIERQNLNTFLIIYFNTHTHTHTHIYIYDCINL